MRPQRKDFRRLDPLNEPRDRADVAVEMTRPSGVDVRDDNEPAVPKKKLLEDCTKTEWREFHRDMLTWLVAGYVFTLGITIGSQHSNTARMLYANYPWLYALVFGLCVLVTIGYIFCYTPSSGYWTQRVFYVLSVAVMTALLCTATMYMETKVFIAATGSVALALLVPLAATTQPWKHVSLLFLKVYCMFVPLGFLLMVFFLGPSAGGVASREIPSLYITSLSVGEVVACGALCFFMGGKMYLTFRDMGAKCRLGEHVYAAQTNYIYSFYLLYLTLRLIHGISGRCSRCRTPSVSSSTVDVLTRLPFL